MDHLLKSFQVGSEREDQCSKHGAYSAMQIGARWTGCPACGKEARDAEASAAAAQRKIEAAERAITAAGIPPRYADARLENVAEANKIRRWIQQVQAGAPASLVMLGSVGTGKTYAACGAARELAAMGVPVKYGTVAGYLRDLRSTWGGRSERSESQVWNQYATVRVLILDEIGAAREGENDTWRVHELIAERYDRNLPGIFISNLGTKDTQGNNPFRDAIGIRAYDRIREGAVQLTLAGESRRGKK